MSNDASSGAPRPCTCRAASLELLVYLVQNRDRVVSKDDLIASVWGGRSISDSTLTSRINAARNAVGESGAEKKLIRTIARKGLRFVGKVRTQPTGAEPEALRAMVRISFFLRAALADPVSCCVDAAGQGRI